MSGRTAVGLGRSVISPRLLGGDEVKSPAPQVASPHVMKFDPARLSSNKGGSGMVVPTKGGWAAPQGGGSGGGSGGPGAPGAPGAPGTPTATPLPPASYSVVPQTVGQPSVQSQWQQAYVQSSVSVPVSVQASPTTQITIAPPAAQDYGPMVPPGVAAGMGAAFSGRCVAFALAGAVLAYALRGRA